MASARDSGLLTPLRLMSPMVMVVLPEPVIFFSEFGRSPCPWRME